MKYAEVFFLAAAGGALFGAGLHVPGATSG